MLSRLKYLKAKLTFLMLIILVFTANNVLFAEANKGKIIMQVNGFKNSTGTARILIFSAKEAKYFPADQSKAYAKHVVPIKNNKVSFTFENLPYGDYAISVHHDEDNNGKVNTNFFGIPNEGLGGSNDAKGFFGPPSFEKAKVMLYVESVSIVINMVN
jgi:uncharacterized protein (DUF2141 family)